MENIVSSDFFLPSLGNKTRVMIAGSGQQVCLKTFLCKCTIIITLETIEDKNMAVFSNDKRNCDCCLIY